MTYEAEVMADTPLAFWKLDETSGTSMVDSSGNARHGIHTNTVLGATAVVPAHIGTGKSATFGNVGTGGRRGVVADAAWMDVVGAITVEAWIKPSTTADDGTIVSRVNEAFGFGGAHYSWFLRRVGTKIEWFVVGSSTGSPVAIQSAAGSIVAGNTYHVVGTHDGVNSRLYINGAQVATAPLAGLFSAGIADIVVGRSVYNWKWFEGNIDAVAFYGSALSATRIGVHYSEGLGGPPPPVYREIIRNLEPQPSFETTENWNGVLGSDNPVPSTEQFFVGTKSLKASRGAGTNTVIARRTNFAAEVLDGAGVYTSLIHLWVPNGLADPRVRVSGAGSSPYAGGPLVLSTQVREQWVPIVLTYQYDGVGAIQYDLLDQTMTVGGYFYADGHICVKGAVPISFFSGDTPDVGPFRYSWLGTANASRSVLEATTAVPLVDRWDGSTLVDHLVKGVWDGNALQPAVNRPV